MKWHIAIPTPAFKKKKSFYSNQGGEALPLVPSAMPVTVVSARICQRGPKRGSEATEQWEVFFFPLPRYIREIF